MNVSNQDLKTLIANVPDANTRRTLEQIVTRQIVKRIKCLGKCKGKVIGFIDNNGLVTSSGESKGSGLRRHRPRLDGHYGFLCKCGNDSSLAAQEKGVIGSRNVTRPDIEKVYGNLSKTPPNYVEKNGSLEVDGFVIEDILTANRSQVK